jgi:prepilin-type N-terminal cleavage/methylation domain-containing protein
MHLQARTHRQGGFSFIEILVVMGIMSLLATMVVVLIPVMTERANQAKSRDNVGNLVKMMLVRSQDKGQGYPSYNGKCFVLSPIADGILDPDAPGACEVFFSPGDAYLKLENVDRAKYKEIDSKKLRAGEDFRTLTSYAGRTNGVKGCIMTPAVSNEIGTLMICDDDDGPIHHAAGLMVGFRDGRVEFLKWEELEMTKPKDPANPEPFLGDSAESPKLKCISSN